MGGLESRIEGTKEQIGELEDRTKETTQSEPHRENTLKHFFKE